MAEGARAQGPRHGGLQGRPARRVQDCPWVTGGGGGSGRPSTWGRGTCPPRGGTYRVRHRLREAADSDAWISGSLRGAAEETF